MWLTVPKVFENLKLCHGHTYHDLMHFVFFFCYAYQCMISRMMITEAKLIIIETFALIQKFVSLIYGSFSINLQIFDKTEIVL